MKKIIEILSDRPDLICDKVYERDVEFVEMIINLPYWKDEKFQGLLTSNIWQSNVGDIKEILKMEEFFNYKYIHLLKPGIFGVSINNIKDTINLLKEYNIDKFVTNRCLRQNVNLQRKLIIY